MLNINILSTSGAKPPLHHKLPRSAHGHMTSTYGVTDTT